MDQYTAVSVEASQLFTKRYSTSFSLASRLFDASIRRHIYAIYGFTRLADEVVDTYRGPQAAKLLDELAKQTQKSVALGYSTNPILQAFAQTAQKYGIDQTLLAPFFKSMQMDLTPRPFTQKDYQTYIHGSAEVVGLMCLKVFCQNDGALYKRLSKPAARLGAAYQKVNFFRDLAEDYHSLGRYYFPLGSFPEFDELTKQQIIDDIRADFAVARPAVEQLPPQARRAVRASYRYYQALLRRLQTTPASQLKTQRVRVPDAYKLWLWLVSWAGR